MLPADKPAMQAIASRIWEGNDYLPAVFDLWVADMEGEFTAVLQGGDVVGCAKLTFLTRSDAWLEGLRKDPRVSVRGLGRAVVEYVLDGLAARGGLSSVRFATYIRNRASIITNERAGFRVRTRLSVKAWEGPYAALQDRISRGATPRSTAEVAVIRDENVVQAFLERHPYFEETQGLVVEGWKAWPWSWELFVQRFVRTGACHGVRGPGGLQALAAWTAFHRDGRSGARLVFLASDTDQAAAALLEAVFRDLAESRGGTGPEDGTVFEAEWMIPPGERYRRWAAAAGLATWEQEEDFLVYEFPVSELEGRAARPSTDGPPRGPEGRRPA